MHKITSTYKSNFDVVNGAKTEMSWRKVYLT